ncbi:MAG: L,D-transpeptidase [Chloroflexi bacterium]|nr:L,D-transpeptidase [Chloroflexota bacterium]
MCPAYNGCSTSYSGYALHGTYWHNNFGQPMSHGCVNLTNADAYWLYNWATLGTPVHVKA